MVQHERYIRALRNALDGDIDAFWVAFPESKRRGERESQLRLLRIYLNWMGETLSIPQSVWPTGHVYMGVQLCWDERIARHLLADIAALVIDPVLEVYNNQAVQNLQGLVVQIHELADAPEPREGLRQISYDAMAIRNSPNVVHWSRYLARPVYDASRVPIRHALKNIRLNTVRSASHHPALNASNINTQIGERTAQYLLGEVIPCWEES